MFHEIKQHLALETRAIRKKEEKRENERDNNEEAEHSNFTHITVKPDILTAVEVGK